MCADCYQKELTQIGCCIATKVNNLSVSYELGDTPTEECEKNLMLLTTMLEMMRCVDVENLEEECLTEDQICTIMKYMYDNCVSCC